MRKLSYLLIATLLAIPAGQSQAGVGQAGGLFLQIAPDARSTAMGETGVAHALGAQVPAWNPGGLGFLEYSGVSGTYFKWLPYLADDLYYLHFSYVHPVEGIGTFGVSVPYLSLGEQQRVSATGDSQGTFKSSDMAVSLSYGALINDRLGVGSNLKIIRSALSDEDDGVGTSFALDVGVTARVMPRFTVAGVLQNLGTEIKYTDSNQGDPLSRNLKVGAALKALEDESNSLLLAVDLNRMLLKDSGNILNVGLEYWYQDLIALRTGYVHDAEGDVKTPTFGGGLQWNMYRIDFSYTTSSTLQDITKFTISARF
ncbi:MAG: PorV/PorQ family protein [Gemmatimonadetes bacterium]|nr:PorV/PorQ family protein [Gemmatimonadota bacterium]MYG84733.1 PorV/PorQ family protein [Gemmatimonadota bacterium]MYJ88742.1 PorV/PorQ family protein [Gemmatimonadota bacterium]